MKKVLITRRTHPSGVSLLAAETEVSELLNPNREQLAPALPGIHGMVAGVSVAFDGDMLDHAPDLVVMARHGVGMDNVDLPAATARGIVVLYTPKAMVTAVAEQAVAFMLAIAKSFKRGDIAIHENKYHTRDQLASVDLYGKTLGIIGCGRIGSRVSQMCSRGLSMNVITYDPYITDEQAAKAGAVRKRTLDEVMSTADVVTLHTPLTSETRHMIGREQIAMMKKSAYLINTARGPVVDEMALVAALRGGQIAGAGLDVFEQEPTHADNPLFSMPNVMCTPHSAGSSQECLQRIAAMVARGILDVLHDHRPDEDCFANPEVWDVRRKLS